MKSIKYFLLIFFVVIFACTDLDIPPKNIFGENEIFGTSEGVNSQLARIYGLIPMEDFRFHWKATGLYNVSAEHYNQLSNMTGEAIGRDGTPRQYEDNSYWDGPYKAIREINLFMEILSGYTDSHSETNMNTWIAEAHFARAYVYYSLVKRYGGVPLVDKVIDYPASVDFEGTLVPRSSEKEIWDFMASDLDYAIDKLPEINQKGRANKYIAAAFKSRVMLHAGSIAKYTDESWKYTVDGVQLCGMDQSLANGYFKAAFDAARIVQESNQYRLYRSEIGADPASKATNYTNLFLKDTEENIFVRYFRFPESVHQWNEHAQPLQTKSGGGSDEVCPSVDFVEMFEGMDKDEDGHLNVFDENGYYKLYDSPIDFFVNAEPRLKGMLIFPIDIFKSQVIEIRKGIYTRAVGDGLERLTPPGDINQYQAHNIPDLFMGMIGAPPIPIKKGGTMSPVGKSGVARGSDYGTITGFYLRKYLDPTPGITTNGMISETDWIEIRYAEVLLNMAEAAYELFSTGQTGANYRTLAFEAINDIRDRAGATLLPNETALNDLNIVRTERRKELAFENKTYFDLKRWRLNHILLNNFRMRVMYPFYSDDADKYFLDVHYQEVPHNNFVWEFDSRHYYEPIPASEINRNPKCLQNKGY